MADEMRRDERTDDVERGPERQGVREPQPADLDTRREMHPADLARANEERTGGATREGMREPMNDESGHRDARQSHARRDGRGESSGMLGRVRDAWDRIRNRA